MERPILFINACVRKASRTRQLAEQLLTRLQRPYAEIRLHEMTFPVVNEDFLAQRDRLIAAGEFQSPVFDLARNYYGIDDVRLIQATGLDLEGADTDALVSAAAEAISGMDLD